MCSENNSSLAAIPHSQWRSASPTVAASTTSECLLLLGANVNFIIALRRTSVNLLVDLLKLHGLLLSDVKSYGEVIVVLDQALDCTCAIL